MPTKALSTSTKIGYSLPLFIRSILHTFIDANLTKYYLEDLCKHSTCLPPSRFGLVSSLIGTLGLFLDIFISHIVDRSHALFRSHLPMILICAPLWCISVMALFYPITFASTHMSSLTQVSIWFTLFSVLKNVVPLDIAFRALGSKLTHECTTQDRDSLFAYKQYADLIGGIVGGFLPFLLTRFTDQQGSYTIYMFCGSITLLISYLIMVTTVKKAESKEAAKKEEKVVIPIIPGLKRSFSNKAFQVMLSLSLFESLRGLLWSGLYPFFFTKVLALDDAQYQLWGGIYNVLGMVLASLFTPMWQMLSRRYGYYNTWLSSYLLQIPVGLLVYLTIDVGQQQVYRYFVFFVLLCITGRASGFLHDSVKASMFDYDEFYTGERREASIEASMSVLPRYISLVSNSVSFGILSYFDSDPVSSAKCVAVQTTLLPSLTAVICFFIMVKFPVDDNKHNIIKEGITAHKEGKEAFDPIRGVMVKAPTSESLRQNMARDHFFGFELTLIQKSGFVMKWFSVLQLVASAVWACVFVFCAWMFIAKTVYEQGNDSLATAALWLSSVSFTLAMFFRERIQVAKIIQLKID
jgi:Na+/melibiose symporter-like transporter